MKNSYYFLVSLLLVACTNNGKPLSEEEKLIQDLRMKHGVTSLQNTSLGFSSRGISYTRIPNDQGGFTYSRTQIDENGDTIVDEWIGAQLVRYINGKNEKISIEKESAYRNSINSVFYFALLPDALADEAVMVNLIDTVKLLENEYLKFQVTFKQENGGEDFEDRYIYWVSLEQGTMDYFAYQYFTEGGGMRFREAINQKTIGGFRFQDYKNYKPMVDVPLEKLDSLFEKGGLELVSEIILEDIRLPMR